MTHPDATPVIDLQLQHRSVRRFTKTAITNEQLELIVTAAQRASTSSNLQAVSVVAVRDTDRKQRLSAAIGGRQYVEDASVFLVWVADFSRNTELLRARGAEAETMGYMENTLVGAVDVGIAAQNALLAAESLGLGGVFVGSIRNNPEAVSRELRLPQHSFPIVGLALGVPDPEEGTGLKPRLPLSGVLHHETYNEASWQHAVETYEADYRAYFETQGVPGRSWAHTVTRRIATPEGMHGRHTMRQSLKEQGFDSE